MDSSTTPLSVSVVQDPTPVNAAKRGRPVGIILHQHGTLRLFKDPAAPARLFVEVNGFRTAAGREFLGDLQWFGDLSSEILVCDDPKGWDLPTITRENHYRRDA